MIPRSLYLPPLRIWLKRRRQRGRNGGPKSPETWDEQRWLLFGKVAREKLMCN